jgi:hypothetical protein
VALDFANGVLCLCSLDGVGRVGGSQPLAPRRAHSHEQDLYRLGRAGIGLNSCRRYVCRRRLVVQRFVIDYNTTVPDDDPDKELPNYQSYFSS